MEGVREKEKGAPLACLLTDGLTDTGAWHSVCSRLIDMLRLDIIELAALLSCLLLLCLLPPLCVIMCHVTPSSPALHLLHPWSRLAPAPLFVLHLRVLHRSARVSYLAEVCHVGLKTGERK